MATTGVKFLFNDSFTQLSQHAWFYAADSNSCVQQDLYFRYVAQCALISTGIPPCIILVRDAL